MNLKDTMLNIPGNMLNIPGKVARKAASTVASVTGSSNHNANLLSKRFSVSDERNQLSSYEEEEFVLKNAKEKVTLTIKVLQFLFIIYIML
jgi:hypothetical protein